MPEGQVVQTDMSGRASTAPANPNDPNFLVTQGWQHFSRAKNARTLIEGRWRRSNDQYDSQHPREMRKFSDVLMGQARLFIPKTYNTIQRMLADLVGAYFFDPEEIVSVTSGKDVPSMNVDAVKAVMNHRLTDHPIAFYQEAFEAIQDGLKNKIGIFKVYPRLKTAQKEVKRSKKMPDDTIVEMVDHETVVTAYEPQIECIAPEDLFLDPGATWKDYWKYPMIHRYVRTRQYFKERGFKNLMNVPGIRDVTLGDQVKMQRSRTGLQSPFYTTLGDNNGDLVCAFEIWAPLEYEGKWQNCVWTLLGMPEMPTHVGLEPAVNTLPYSFSEFEDPRPPFVVGSAFPEAHKPYGKDLPEFTEQLQTEINIIRNQDREAAALAIRKPILMNKDSGIDATGLVNRKIGGVIVGDDISQDMVRELSLSSPIINTEMISQRNDADYQEATSMAPPQFGGSTKDETATGVTRSDNNANKKIELVGRNLAWTLFTPAFRLLLRLEQAYETDDYIFAVTGKKLGWKRPNDGTPAWPMIQGDFDLSIELGMNKQTQLNRYFMLMDRANQANLTTGQMVQNHVMDPKDAKFIDPMWGFKKIAAILHQKNITEMQIPAMPPPPPAPAGPGGPPAPAGKGTASQPGAAANPGQSTSSMNPEEEIAGLLQ